MLEKVGILIVVVWTYTFPIWLALIGIWFYRKFIGKDSRCADFISGLIFTYAMREVYRMFRVKGRNRRR